MAAVGQKVVGRLGARAHGFESFAAVELTVTILVFVDVEYGSLAKEREHGAALYVLALFFCFCVHGHAFLLKV